MFPTGTALAVHAFKVHGLRRPTSRYTFDTNSCLNCMLQFSTRNGLIEHLQCGMRICLLNIILRLPPTTEAEDVQLRADAQKLRRENRRSGIGRHIVDFPAYRVHGPMWRMVNIQGCNVTHMDREHPVGPGSRLGCPL